MPITFEAVEGQNYFLTVWQGTIVNDEMVALYVDYLIEHGPKEEYRELADFSEADVSMITIDGLRELSRKISEYCSDNNLRVAKCASFIPGVINHSIMELYDYLSHQSPEKTRVFTSKKLALNWLLE